MNSKEIIDRENQSKMLKIQYAARVHFNKGERNNKIVWILCIISALLIFMPSKFNTYANYVAFALDLMMLFFNSKIEKEIKKAAELRNYFDYFVFNINDKKYSKSDVVQLFEDAEIVFSNNKEEAETQLKNTGHDDPPGVKDWYEFKKEVNGLDSILECQKQNIWWNKKMTNFRKKVTTTAVLALLVSCYILIKILEKNCFTTILCSFGILSKFYERFKINKQYDKLSNEINGAFAVLQSNPTIEGIRSLQDLINSRRECSVFELNSYHKHNANLLSDLYNKTHE